jgi:hypothetical protein
MGEWVRGRANGRSEPAVNGWDWKIIRRDWAVDLAIASGCAIFLGLVGPFGSYLNGPAWQRVGFQLVLFWPGVLLYGWLIRVALRLRWTPLATWLLIIGMAVVLNAPFQIWVSFVARSIWPFLKFLRPIDWYVEGLVTTLPVVFGMTLLMRARLHDRQLAKEANDAPPTPYGLLGAATSAVICLQMEDHYVRVHTASGSRLVLTTLGQAIAAMGEADGLQVHRSWWVANRAVVRAVAEGRNWRLQLANGIMAPVARSAVAAVRSAGWLGGEN